MKEIFEKIKERLKANSVSGRYGNEYVESVFLNQAIENVNQVEEEYSNSEIPNKSDDGWIPVSSGKLPEQPKENPVFENKPLELYLVSVKGDDYPFRAFWNGKFFTNGWKKIEVTAWQPLPASYQLEGE